MPGQLPAGDYDLRFVIDPDHRISEKSRANDVVVLPFRLREHPAGVELELRRDELEAVPDVITVMPQPLVLRGRLRNLGLTPAPGVRIVAFDGDPRQGVVVGETMADVPGVGSVLFEIAASVSGARPHEIFVVADPDRLTGDPDTFEQPRLEAAPGSSRDRSRDRRRQLHRRAGGRRGRHPAASRRSWCATAAPPRSKILPSPSAMRSAPTAS